MKKIKLENIETEIKSSHMDIQFKDIENHWAKKDIELMYYSNIVRGLNQTTFAPNKPVTRA